MAHYETMAQFEFEVQRVIDSLDRIDASDPERAHGEAEHQLLLLAPRRVQEAYERVIERAPWWGTA